jgi:hypothetical protein
MHSGAAKADGGHDRLLESADLLDGIRNSIGSTPGSWQLALRQECMMTTAGHRLLYA